MNGTVPPLLQAERDPTSGRFVVGCQGRRTGSVNKFSREARRIIAAHGAANLQAALDFCLKKYPHYYCRYMLQHLRPYRSEQLEDDAGDFADCETVQDVIERVRENDPELLDLFTRQPRRLRKK
jgi:hypothetical protein